MRNNQWLPGIILIGLGVLLLVGRSTAFSGDIVLVGLGALFAVAYFGTRGYGWLIPGCILLGLGLGQLAGQSDLGLGLGFIGIFAIDTIVRGRMSHWWPLIPGVIIAGDALLNARIPGIGSVRALAADWWPVLLIVLGVWVLLRASSRGRA